jgi:hypothetical protein
MRYQMAMMMMMTMVMATMASSRMGYTMTMWKMMTMMMTMNKLVVLHQIVATDVVCHHSCTSVHSYRLRLCNNSINQVI